MKLNVLLAKTEHAAASFKAIVKEYTGFFKGHQGAFQGIKKTYTPKEGTADIPDMRGEKRIQTTVNEKLDFFKLTQSAYIDNLFSFEATNASGVAKAELIVEGRSFGKLTSLELMRLKTLLQSSELETMYAAIPVRSDAEIWSESDEEHYKERKGIFATPLQSGKKNSIMKENYILPDPNVQYLKDTSKYQPVVGTKDTLLELGEYTLQNFSGEYSQFQRAEILRRRSVLLNAVIAALKEANDVEVVSSEVTSEKLFGYLHTGEF